MIRLLRWLKWYIEQCNSEVATISFGRTMSMVITFYFLATDAWLFHRTGHLVDNATLLTQFSGMTMFYTVNKLKAAFDKPGQERDEIEVDSSKDRDKDHQ